MIRDEPIGAGPSLGIGRIGICLRPCSFRRPVASVLRVFKKLTLIGKNSEWHFYFCYLFTLISPESKGSDTPQNLLFLGLTEILPD